MPNKIDVYPIINQNQHKIHNTGLGDYLSCLLVWLALMPGKYSPNNSLDHGLIQMHVYVRIHSDTNCQTTPS